MKRKKRILLVEDEAITALAETRELEKYGYEVQIAHTGEEAVEAAVPASKIDLILMDINLGSGIDGTETAKIILKKQDIPIIFLSSHTEPDVVYLTERITSYGYVVKQSGITVLDASIKMAFRLYLEKQLVNHHQEEIHASNEELQAAIEEMEATSEELHATNEQLMESQERLIERDRELSASEHRYRTLFHSLIEGVCLHEVIYDESGSPIDYKILEANQRYEEILDLNKEDVVNRRASEIYAITPPPYLETYARVADTGIPEQLETYFPPMKKHFMISIFSPENGKFATIFEDVTLRKKTESQLRESEEKYRTYIENAPEGVFIADPDARYVDVNEAACRMTGYSRDELLSMSIPELLSPAGGPLQHISFQTLKKEGKTEAEVLLKKKNGENFYIMLSAGALSGDRFMAYCTDISKRKKTEEALIESGKRFRLLVENLREGIVFHAPDTAILFSNTRASNLLGISKDKMTGKMAIDPAWKFIKEDGSFFEVSEYPASQVIDKKSSLSNMIFGVQKPGSENIAWLMVNGYPFFTEEGELNHVVITFNDITEIKNLLKEKDLLMREVHHRIKNDMSTIRSLLSIQGDRSSNPEVREILSEAENRILLMANIYTILYQNTNVDSIDILEFLTGLIEMVTQSNSLLSDITIETRIDPIQISAGDSFPIGIIINELFTNALKYAFPEKKTGSITVSAQEKSPGTLELVVTDTGVGISEEIIKTKEWGFGLLLVETMVKQNRGKLDISGNDGTTVTATLPVNR